MGCGASSVSSASIPSSAAGLENKPSRLAHPETVEPARPAVKGDGVHESAEAHLAPCDCCGPRPWTQPYVLTLLELLAACQGGPPAVTVAERMRLHCSHDKAIGGAGSCRGPPVSSISQRCCIVTASAWCGAGPLAACLTRYFHPATEAEVGERGGGGGGFGPAASLSTAAAGCCSSAYDQAVRITLYLCPRGGTADGGGDGRRQRDSAAPTRPAVGETDGVTPPLTGVAGCDSVLACIDEAGDLLASRPFVQLIWQAVLANGPRCLHLLLAGTRVTGLQAAWRELEGIVRAEEEARKNKGGDGNDSDSDDGGRVSYRRSQSQPCEPRAAQGYERSPVRARRGSMAHDGQADGLAALSGTRPGTELGQIWGPLLLHGGGQASAFPPTRGAAGGTPPSSGKLRRRSASRERNSTGVSVSVRRRTGSDGGSVAGPCAWLLEAVKRQAELILAAAASSFPPELFVQQQQQQLGDIGSGTGFPSASKPLEDAVVLYSGPEGACHTAAPPQAAQLGQDTVPLSQVLLNSGGGGDSGSSATVAAPRTPELQSSGGGSVRGGELWPASRAPGAAASADLLVIVPSPKRPLSSEGLRSPKQRPRSPFLPEAAASWASLPPGVAPPPRGVSPPLLQAGGALILLEGLLLLSPWQRSEAQAQAAELELCGGLLGPGGQLLAAKRAYLMAMQLHVACHGACHDLSLGSLRAAAAACASLGQHGEALQLRLRAWSVLTAARGPACPEALASLVAVGEAYRQLGDTRSAVEVLRRACALLDTHLGPLHDKALACQVLLAAALRQAHQDAPMNQTRGSVSSGDDTRGPSALEVLEQLHSRQAAKHGPRSTEAVAALHAVACCQQRLGRPGEAEASWERAVDLLLISGNGRPQRGGEGGDGTGEAVRHGGGSGAGADVAASRTSGGAADFLGLPDAHPQAMAVLQSLAGCRYGAGRLAEAVPLYERLAEGRETAYGPEHPDAMDAARLLRAVQAQLPANGVTMMAGSKT